jgi:hypothetical protein
MGRRPTGKETKNPDLVQEVVENAEAWLRAGLKAFVPHMVLEMVISARENTNHDGVGRMTS